MKIFSMLQKRSKTNRMTVTALSVFLIAALLLSLGMSAFAETGENEGDGTDVVAEVTDSVDETADPIEETTDPVDEPTDPVDETTEPIEEELSQLSLLAAFAETDVCSVGEVGYESINDAIEANTNGTITMLQDVAYNVNCAIEIPAGKSFTLDLNGKTISGTAPDASTAYVINNNGTLTIKDSAGGGKITMNAAQPAPYPYNYACNAVRNRGTMTVSSGTITNTTSASACYALDTYNGSSLTINNGSFTAAKSDAVRLYCGSDTDSCVAVINGGYFNGKRSGVYLQCPVQSAKGSLTINGGTFETSNTGADPLAINSSGSSIDHCRNAAITINGGTFNGHIGIGSKMPSANVAINGGTFNGQYGAFTYSKTDKYGFITGGRFNGTDLYECDETNPDIDHFPCVDFIADGYAAIYEKDGVRYAESELDDCTGLPFDVYKLTEVTVTPDAKIKYTDQTADPELTYTIDKSAAKSFITVELERAPGTAVGSYPITAKTLKGGLDTTDPDNPMYYLPVLSAAEVNLEIKDGGYIKHTAENDDLPEEGSVAAESYARSDVELVVESTAPAVEQTIEDKLADNEDMLFTQEIHFERDNEYVAVGDVCRDGKVDISFNVGEKYNGLSVVIYHVVNAARTDKIGPLTVENGKVTYTAYSLSPFGIALLKNNLTVTSAISGSGASSADEFSYKLKLNFSDTFDYDIQDKSGTVLSSGSISDGGEFKLKGNQKMIIKDLPVGVEYEITETAPSGYTISFKDNKGKVAASGSTAAFTSTKGSTSGGNNEPETGDESTVRNVQICVVIANISLMVIFCLIYFDKNKSLARLFSRAAERFTA